MREREGWDEVEKAQRDGSLYNADKETLHRYLKAVTDSPPSTNPAFHAALDQTAQTIRHLIAQQANHQIQIGTSLRWAKIAAFAAILGVILMIIQLIVAMINS
ncbi:MAG: hypothetical protein NT011_03560 [Kiritimatiellaeota bacterium]|nr:hypothetical protein [Kiritimatiellota bacterium]